MGRTRYNIQVAMPSRRAFLASLAAAAQTAPPKPNIVFILADDLGWAELGCYGNTFNETPHLDRLAVEGVRFTCAYSAAPVCSPTRASIMTGQHPVRVGILDFLRADDPNHLSPAKYNALPKRLAAQGYKTALIGKWHLMGDYKQRLGDPAKHGFQEVICSESSYIGPGYYFPPYKHMAEVQPNSPNEYLTDRLNAEAAAFVRRNAKQPFFLYLSHYAPHTALVAKPDLEARFSAKPGASPKQNNPKLAAMLFSLDEGVGLIRKALEETGQLDNTLFVFCSDNGGEDRVTKNGPLRAGKSTLYEGGIRIPFLARLPNKQHAGKVVDAPITTLDLMPGFLRAAGSPLTADLEGRPFLDAVSNPDAFQTRPLHWHYPLDKPHFLGGRSAGAIRKGDWKMILFYDDSTEQLYNLKAYPGETDDRATRNPEIAFYMKRQFQAWRKP
jgi:arylsulfatase A